METNYSWICLMQLQRLFGQVIPTDLCRSTRHVSILIRNSMQCIPEQNIHYCRLQ